jgi:hypothetical protein
MSYAVKISEIEMNALRESAALQSRSLSGQAEHWLRLGRAFERDPRFGFSKVELALKGLLSPDELADSEQEEYFDGIGDGYWKKSNVADSFFDERRRRGLGVGMDEAGNVVLQASAGARG